jgi:hypothetical protein
MKGKESSGYGVTGDDNGESTENMPGVRAPICGTGYAISFPK